MNFYRLSLTLSLLALTACGPQPNLVVPEPYQEGQKIYHKVCGNCHGADALGKNVKAPKLIDEEYLAVHFSDDDFKNQIIDGSDKMPSMKGKVSDADIDQIIKYLRYSQKAAGLEPEDEEEDLEEEPEGQTP
ncbi:MAG: cytochrome c [Candidatus Nitrohelix vancouverensis]|uniref:Cytochrome c n=1 Tax=Candidatus Nitrohelix vancouverensis TaxID=2705534 RepID=A0A7T0C304_9BACT|nr:MAG: cytochrome c [Candidatus Nitrohelix vancouverensis]